MQSRRASLGSRGPETSSDRAYCWILGSSPLRGSPKYDSLRETVGIAAPHHVTPADEPGAIPRPARDAVVQRGRCGRAPFRPAVRARPDHAFGASLREPGHAGSPKYDSLREPAGVAAPHHVTPASEPGSSHKLAECLPLPSASRFASLASRHCVSRARMTLGGKPRSAPFIDTQTKAARRRGRRGRPRRVRSWRGAASASSGRWRSMR